MRHICDNCRGRAREKIKLYGYRGYTLCRPCISIIKDQYRSMYESRFDKRRYVRRKKR